MSLQISHAAPAKPNYLDTLRAFLRDVPEDASFSESVKLLNEAFDPSMNGNPAAWASSAVSGLHSVKTLKGVFGQFYDHGLFSAGFAVRGELETLNVDPYWTGVPKNLRDLVDRFAVVGYEEAVEPRPKAVLLRGGLAGSLDAPMTLAEEDVPALELFRVRQGLMNRRQAVLLVSHLNRFRRNADHNQVLNWRVVRGPEIEGSARQWLDSLGADSMRLRGLTGATETWGLGDATHGSLNQYEVVCAATHSAEQVFAYDRPRYVLPPRYEVLFDEADFSSTSGMTSSILLRKEACTAARMLAQACFSTAPTDGDDSCLLGAGYRIKVVRCGERGDWDYEKSFAKSIRRYAHGMERSEAIAAARCLRMRVDVRNVRVCAVPQRLRIEKFDAKGRMYVGPYDLVFNEMEVFEPHLFVNVERLSAGSRAQDVVSAESGYVAVWAGDLAPRSEDNDSYRNPNPDYDD